MKLVDLKITPKQQLHEAHEAIKIRWMNGSDFPKEAVNVYETSDQTTFRFYGLPSEFEIKHDDEDSPYEKYSARRDSLTEYAQELGLTLTDEVKELLSELRMAWYASKDEKKDPSLDSFHQEIAEITEHLTTLFKAKALEYIHETHGGRDKRFEQIEQDIRAKLKNLAK